MKYIIKKMHETITSYCKQNLADHLAFGESALKRFCECKFVITLMKAGSLKREIREYDVFFSYNGIHDKTALLLENFPKYLWRCNFYDAGKRFLDFLIDTTEVPQGNLILGGIQYSDEADRFWRSCKILFNDQDFLSDVPSVSNHPFFSTLARFFTAKDNDDLNSYYGPVRLPNRPVRNSELDGSGNIVPLTDIRHFAFGKAPSDFLAELSPDAVYLWVIDENGDLILGRESFDKDEPAGHPALLCLYRKIVNFSRKKRWKIL